MSIVWEVNNFLKYNFARVGFMLYYFSAPRLLKWLHIYKERLQRYKYASDTLTRNRSTMILNIRFSDDAIIWHTYNNFFQMVIYILSCTQCRRTRCLGITLRHL